MSNQPSGLSTPEACKKISPGYAFFAYPGYHVARENRAPKAVRGVASSNPKWKIDNDRGKSLFLAYDFNLRAWRVGGSADETKSDRPFESR
jgi:hypothetical protein